MKLFLSAGMESPVVPEWSLVSELAGTKLYH